MRYRKLDPVTGDRVFGHGLADFWQNVPDAPAQAVWTRLQLYTGQWFLDLRAGTPWNTRVLGKYTGSTRDPVLRARALGTPGVSAIVAYSSSVNRDTRAFSVNMTLDTIYGSIVVENAFGNPPGPPGPTTIDSTTVTIDSTTTFQ